MRSTSGTTKQTKTSANKNIVRQSQHSSAPAVARSCSVRRQDKPSNSRNNLSNKKTLRTAVPNRFNQPNRAKTAEQTTLISKHAEKHFASTVRVSTKAHCATKKQTHAAHRDKKQKTGFNPNFTRKLTEGARKTQKNTVFHVKHSIFYLLIFHKHIGYHIAKSRNCRKSST